MLMFSQIALAGYLSPLLHQGLITAATHQRLTEKYQSGNLYITHVVTDLIQQQHYLLALDALDDFVVQAKSHFGQDYLHPTALSPEQLNQWLNTLHNKINVLQILRRFEDSLVLVSSLIEAGYSDVETIGLQASVNKSLGFTRKECDKTRSTAFLSRALDGYLSVYSRDPKQYYVWHGLNAATLLYILDETDESNKLCLQLQKIVAERNNDSYWHLACQAELSLLCFLLSPAEHQLADTAISNYRLLVQHSDNHLFYRSVIRNLSLLEQKLQADDGLALLNKIITLFPEIQFFTLINDTQRLLKDEARKSPSTKTEMHLATTPSETNGLAIMTLLPSLTSLNVMLPFPWQQYRKHIKMAKKALEAWDSVLANEATGKVKLYVLSQRPMLINSVMFAYLQQCLTKLNGWLCEQYPQHRCTHIVADEQSTPATTLFSQCFLDTKPEENKYRIKTALFADILNFSQIEDSQIEMFFSHVWLPVSRILDSFSDNIDGREAWGDGLHIMFNSPDAAIQCSQKIMAFFSAQNLNQQWHKWALPEKIEIRIGLETAPVIEIIEPIENKKSYSGNFITRAARIEPITAPGKIYCGLGTYLLTLKNNQQPIQFNYLGLLPLSKNHGNEHLFEVKPHI